MTPDEAIKLMEFNLTEEANEESLKKQFKKMVMKYHPDKNKIPGATEKFIKIKEAYETLQLLLKQRQVIKQQESTVYADGVTIRFTFGNQHYSTGTNPSWSFVSWQ